MNKVYIPKDVFYKCVTIRDKDTIRVYHDNISYDKPVSYTDFFINSNYYSKTGTETFYNYSYTTLPTCLPNNLITHDFYYKVDFDKSLILFLVISFISLYLPFMLFSRLFRRFFR